MNKNIRLTDISGYLDLQMAVWLRKQSNFSFTASFNTSCELQAFKSFFQVNICYQLLLRCQIDLHSDQMFQENGKLDHKYHFAGETGNQHGWSFPLKCLDLALQVEISKVVISIGSLHHYRYYNLCNVIQSAYDALYCSCGDGIAIKMSKTSQTNSTVEPRWEREPSTL